MTIYVLSRFNNYYNRTVKKFDTIEEYQPYVHYSQENYNFVPNDEVNTQVVLGSNVNMYGGAGDYLLVVSKYNEIVSRWFIVESVRDRAGQYTLTLHRDLVADRYDELLNAPMFIEKAILGDGDPLIYNSEDMTFNQIKQSLPDEGLLKDETKSAWIVGYMSSKPFVDGDGTTQDKISSKIQYHLPVDEAYASAANYPFYKYSDKVISGRLPLFSSPTNKKVCIYIRTPSKNTLYYGRKFAFNEQGSQNTGILGEIGYSREFPYNWLSSVWNDSYQCPSAGSSMIWENSLVGSDGVNLYPSIMLDYFKRGFSGKYNNIFNLLDTQVSSVDPELIQAENGKRIYFQDTNKYYKVRVEVNEKTTTEILPSYNSSLWIALKDGYIASRDTYDADPAYQYSKPTWADLTGITADPNSYSFSINFDATTYSIYLEEQPEPTLTYEIQIDNKRWHLNDAPYDMFCIPYSDDLIINNGNALLCQANKELAFQTALALGRDYMGAGYIYDIQLLPYCPVRECIQPDGTFDVQSANHYEIKSYTEDEHYLTGDVVGTVIFSTVSNFTLNITNPISITNKKIQTNCDTWRLCSPNYSGLFEFNVAKNDGVQYFNIDCTYKPYNPYIHINPNFQGLYGYDANDMRGLVCGGDFSLPQVTDAWRTYELNNKNYQEIFDRNIQSMEVKNSVQRNQQIFGAITGTAIGGASGALVGSKAGPYGAIAGAVVGTAASAIGGILDVQYGDILRNEALDYTKDMFGYQLGNIQALPYSLAKTSAFTANNKIWPFLEYYTCTETEKRALANKIAWNGMTVMRIGTMNEFIGNTWSYQDIKSKGYIKGKLIRLEELIGDDYHIVNALSGELDKGVFIQ